MCCWPVNHSSWGEKSFSKDFILHELNECKRSSCSGLWLIKKKKKRISVMLSARFVQSTRIQKSVPKQPKDLQTAGGPMWCSDVPCFAEIISGALEATGSAKGALGPTQAVRLGHQFSELYGWVCSGEIHVKEWNLGPGRWLPLLWGWRLVHEFGMPSPTDHRGSWAVCLCEQCFTGKAEFYWLQGQPWVPLSNTVYHFPRVLSLGTGASEVSLQC